MSREALLSEALRRITDGEGRMSGRADASTSMRVDKDIREYLDPLAPIIKDAISVQAAGDAPDVHEWDRAPEAG